MGEIRVWLDDTLHGDLLRAAKMLHLGVPELARRSIARGLRLIEEESAPRR